MVPRHLKMPPEGIPEGLVINHQWDKDIHGTDSKHFIVNFEVETLKYLHQLSFTGRILNDLRNQEFSFGNLEM